MNNQSFNKLPAENKSTLLKKFDRIINFIEKNTFIFFIWKNEKNWPIEYVSENVSDLLGYTAKELIAKKKNYSKIIYHDDLKALKKQFTAEELSENLTRKEYRLVKKSGEIIWVEDRSILVRSANGKVIYFEGVIIDVTNRKKLEEALKYRIELEKRIVEISNYIFRFEITDINEALSYAMRHIGAFIKMDIGHVYFVDHEKNRVELHDEFIRTDCKKKHKYLNLYNEFYKYYYESTKDFEVLIIQNLKEYCKLHKSIHGKLCESGVKSLIAVPFFMNHELAGFLVYYYLSKEISIFENDKEIFELLSDILGNIINNFAVQFERQKTNIQMRKLQKAVEQSANSIVITDINGDIEYVNPKFVSLTGYSLEEAVGQNPRILKSGHTKPAEYETLWKTILKGETWTGEFKNIAKDGSVFWENATISPIKSDEGVITNFIAIKEDITERIKVETQLSLSQKMESIGQLAAGIAHEINTPMQYIGDNINFLADSYDLILKLIYDFNAFLEDGNKYTNDEIREFYQKAKEELDLEFIFEEIPEAMEQTKAGVEKVTKIVRAMKDFAHPGFKKKAYQNLNKGIEDTVIISKNEWKYVAEVELDLDPEITGVYCLLDELNQVFLNMIVNAAQAIAEKIGEKPSGELGKIKITTKKEGDKVVITISDTGTGISPENQHKIFDPFFTTKEIGKGTGQGLAIAHDIIVTKHNGTVEVKSEEGVGTTFIIALPIDENDEVKNET